MSTSKLNAPLFETTQPTPTGGNRTIKARGVLAGRVDINPSVCGVSPLRSGVFFSAPSTGSAIQTYAWRQNNPGSPADSLTLVASNGSTDNLIIQAVPVGASPPYSQYAVVIDLAAGGRAGTFTGTGSSQTVNVTGCSASSTVQIHPVAGAAFPAAAPTITPAAGSFSLTAPAGVVYNYVVWG